MEKPINLSFKDAFEVAKQIQKVYPSYYNCHTLGHKIASIETKENPDDWKDILSYCPANLCNNGCLHGVIAEKFQSGIPGTEELTNDLKEVCLPRQSWNPTNSEIYMCYHGIGHLALYLTNADTEAALALCREISKTLGYYEACIEGTFMQIFQPLEMEDKLLVKYIAPNKETVQGFCSKFSDSDYHACNRESWVYFREGILTPGGITLHCSYTSDPVMQERCYSSLLNPITSEILIRKNNYEEMASFCTQLNTEFSGLCFAQTARRTLQIDPSLQDKAFLICQKAQEASEEYGEECYAQMANYADWIYQPETKEYNQYCLKLPDEWQKQCLSP
jgi:hypothetical protein